MGKGKKSENDLSGETVMMDELLASHSLEQDFSFDKYLLAARVVCLHSKCSSAVLDQMSHCPMAWGVSAASFHRERHLFSLTKTG